jgi:hypothetical protein
VLPVRRRHRRTADGKQGGRTEDRAAHLAASTSFSAANHTFRTIVPTVDTITISSTGTMTLTFSLGFQLIVHLRRRLHASEVTATPRHKRV